MVFYKGRSRWFWRLAKWGVVVIVCYRLWDFFSYWVDYREVRDSRRKERVKCEKKFSDSDYLPIRGGGLLDASRVNGFHWYIKVRNGECEVDNLEGLFIWTGKEIRNGFDADVQKEKQPDWRYFTVGLRLYVRLDSNTPHKTGYQSVDWPEELTVNLKNYPGLGLWLRARPPSIENEFAIMHFVMRGWRRSDGTPRIITCSGLDSSSIEELGVGLSTKELLRLNKEQLEVIDFGDLNAFCKMDVDSFYFSGGSARIGLDTTSLKGAPEALKSMSDYLSRSVITGSER